jgi:hypothetical protein
MTSAETPAFVRDYLARFDDTWTGDTPQDHTAVLCFAKKNTHRRPYRPAKGGTDWTAAGFDADVG